MSLGKKWRILRLVQDLQLFGDEFHLAGGHIGIDRVGRALANGAGNGDHVFIAQLLGFLVQFTAGRSIEHCLCHAAAVAHIDKDDVAEVAALVHPSHDRGALAGVG